MSRGFQALSLTLLFALSFGARAQLDSSSAVLLRSGSKAPAKQNLDSSRYRIRAPESRKDDDDVKPETLIPSPVPGKTTSKSSASAAATATTLVVTPEPPPPAAAVPAPVEPVAEPVVEPAPPPVTEQVKTLILGGTQEDIEEYRQAIHPQDPRANVLGISIAPAYFYNGSTSTYSYRDFSSHGPGLALGMNFWLTPFFGVQSRYFQSASAGVRSGGTDMVSYDLADFEAGIRFRKHFGYSRKASHLKWGLDYHDVNAKISKEATTLIGRKTSGLSLTMEAVIPQTATYAHTLQVDIRPRQKHSEQATAVDTKSGTKAETNAVGIAIGGEWTLDRRHQIYWKGRYGVERNLFKGTAAGVDPTTGQTPSGVSVTDSLLMFHFGFKWGS